MGSNVFILTVTVVPKFRVFPSKSDASEGFWVWLFGTKRNIINSVKDLKGNFTANGIVSNEKLNSVLFR